MPVSIRIVVRLLLFALIAILESPGVAVASGTGLVFVSNEKSDTVTVIDPELLAVKKTIATSGRPRGMRINPLGTMLYVACGDDDVIDVIDIASLEVVDQIFTGPSPEVFAFSPDGTLIYVSNEEDSTLEVIDLNDRIVVHDIPTGAEPEGVIVGKDGATVYVASEVADLVHVIDAKEGYVTKNIVVGTRPRRFALTPDGGELWVSAELSGEVYVLDRQTYEIRGVISFLPPGMRNTDVTPVALRITEDGKTAIVTLGRANHVAFVDVASHEIEKYVLVGRRAWGLGLTADEQRLFVSNGLSDDVTVIDMDTRSAIKSIPVGRVPHSVVIDD